MLGPVLEGSGRGVIGIRGTGGREGLGLGLMGDARKGSDWLFLLGPGLSMDLSKYLFPAPCERDIDQRSELF